MSGSEGNVVPFPRRPLPDDHGALRLDADGPALMTRCEDPVHLFMNAAAGAVCQCGEATWINPEEGAVQHES